MKKFYSILILVLISVSLFAQKDVVDRLKVKEVKTEKSKILTKDFKVVPFGSKEIPVGTAIGFTNYDLQSNSSAVNRLINHGDGTLSAVWIQYQGTNMPAAPERGTGYNYFDGTDWQYTTFTGNVNIEGGSVKTGWPEIFIDGDGNEFVINHYNASGGYFGWNQTVGASDNGWTSSNADATYPLLWPRATSSGDYIHITGVVHSDIIYNDQSPAPIYMRSSDNGDTWDGLVTIPESGPQFYTGWSADSYAIDAYGSTVAIVEFGNFEDLALWKSTDNGDTWVKTIIWDYPVDAYDIVTGTEIVDMNDDGFADVTVLSDNTGDVIVDANGVVHVVFGRMRFVDDDPSDGGSISWYPYTDWIMYWNDGMGAGEMNDDAIFAWDDTEHPFQIDSTNISLLADTIGWVPDLNENGELDFPELGTGEYPFGFHGLTGMSTFPSLAKDASGNIYCAYSTVMEGGDFLKTEANPNAAQFRHVWITKYNGEAWGDPVLVSAVDGNQAESIFPTMAKDVDDNLHIWFQWDNEPGTFLKEEEDGEVQTDNYIVYKAIPVTEFPDATAETYSITFDVVQGDSDGPLPNAKVTFAYGSKMTDGSGTSVFTNAQPKLYSYIVSHESCPDDISGTINVSGDVTETVDMGDCGVINVENITTDSYIKIYPNPASSHLSIAANEINHVEILNILGSKVKDIDTNFDNIDISEMQAGNYFVKIYTSDKVVLKKLVVK